MLIIYQTWSTHVPYMVPEMEAYCSENICTDPISTNVSTMIAMLVAQFYAVMIFLVFISLPSQVPYMAHE